MRLWPRRKPQTVTVLITNGFDMDIQSHAIRVTLTKDTRERFTTIIQRPTWRVGEDGHWYRNGWEDQEIPSHIRWVDE